MGPELVLRETSICPRMCIAHRLGAAESEGYMDAPRECSTACLSSFIINEANGGTMRCVEVFALFLVVPPLELANIPFLRGPLFLPAIFFVPRAFLPLHILSISCR